MQHPERIGKYQIEEYLGGGMSRVYRARDSVIGRTVAVKILTEEAAADPEAKARFLREAQLAGSLAHENVMAVYDFGEDEGRPFMVTEFLRGEDLRHAIQRGHFSGFADKLRAAQQIAKALEYIHAQGIIHRDIKPENVHLSATGTIKLMDFGIAKTQDLSLTRPGYTMGTPYYMAPEQVMGSNVTHLADIYAFGVMLYELCVGAKPFQAETVEQLFYAILNQPLDLEPLRAAGAPERICRLVERATAKNAADRPQSFSEVRREIEETLREWESPAPAPVLASEPSRPRSSWLLYAAVAALVLLMAATGLYYAFRHRAATPEETKAPAPLSATISTPTGEMVLVPSGRFLAGEGRTPTDLRAFYIDRTEVSNRAYAAFCRARERPLPPGFREDQPDLPVVNITFVDAQEFAKWAGKRLPTRLEWEKAARGADGRAYPWGETHDPSRANVADNPAKPQGPVAVGGFATGASPYGVLQMAGNVWEFVDELRTPSAGAVEAFRRVLTPPATADEPWYTMCGGSFQEPLVKNVAWEWAAVPARYRSAAIGLRCVKDAR